MVDRNVSISNGLYEPLSDNEKATDFVTASGLVHVNDKHIIPVRMWTLCDGVRLKKGMVIGKFTPYEKVTEAETVRAVVSSDENRWETLRSKLEKTVNDESVSEEDRKKLELLLRRYADVFSISKHDIGLTKMVKHKIDTSSAVPITCRRGRIPIGLEAKVDEMIQDFENKGIIRPSNSAWNAPLVIVPKKDGNIRLTVDYRQLNAITRRPIFPIPDTTELLDTLNGSAYFSTLDFSSGYYNIPMCESDIEKTAFSTQKNHYEFLRMPMGLSTAPATFQKLMHTLFHEENWSQCLIYLDDILVFSRNLDEHLRRLEVIFTKIREAGLKLAPEKCHFLKSEVAYLGHVISKDGTHTDPKKIDKILNWPKPATEEDMRSFLGLCGYYRRFIKNYAHLVNPLEKLCNATWNKKIRNKKKHIIEFEPVHEESFLKLKTALTTAPILAFPTTSDKFILDTDASHDAIGAVLSQIQNGKEKVIAYGSKKLSQSQRQYCITRKELFAVYHFVTYFKHYLLGRNFIVRTDHRALCWMINWRSPNTSQYCRWKQELEIFDMDIQYRKGEQHQNADALSRLPLCGQCELKHVEPKKKRNVKSLNSKRREIHCRRIITLENEIEQEKDISLRTIMQLLKKGKANEHNPKELHCLGVEGKSLWNKRQDLRFRGGLLYLKDGNCYRLLVPHEDRQELIKSVHQNLAHIGISKTYGMLKESYYWKNMELDVRLVIAECKHCGRRKTTPNAKHFEGNLMSGYPFEKISIDLAGPLTPGENGERYILGIIDNFSRFVVLVPLKHGTAIEVSKALMRYWIAIFGTPQSIHSDRGTEFENSLIKSLCELLGIKKTKSAPYFPTGNSMVERLFRTVKDLIYATVQSSGRKWTEVLPLVERALRCTTQRTTNFSPFEIVFGRKMNVLIGHHWVDKAFSPHEYIRDIQNVNKRINEYIGQKIKEQTNSMKPNVKPYSVGDHVMAKSYPIRKGMLFGRYSGPYVIVKCLGKWTYRLEHIRDKDDIIERNYYQLKPTKVVATATNGQGQATTVESASRHCEREHMPIEINNPTGQTSRRYPQRQRQPPLRYGYS